MKNLKFYKESSGRWYVDLPEWEGEQADLEMVCGADTFLDILAQDETEVYINVSVTPIPNSTQIVKTEECDPYQTGGAFYQLKEHIGIPYSLRMWLCDVTKYVFGNFPDSIYFCKN